MLVAGIPTVSCHFTDSQHFRRILSCPVLKGMLHESLGNFKVNMQSPVPVEGKWEMAMTATKSSDEAPRPRAQDIDHHVGTRIRERRIMLGLTQQHIADLIGEVVEAAPQQRLLLELARSFMALPSRRHQEAICTLARVLASVEPRGGPDQAFLADKA
jgi:hypothetical protein